MSITIGKTNLPFSSEKHKALTAWLLGGVHLLVDLGSISALYCALRASPLSADWAAPLILSYDFIAFATQMLIGHALDRIRFAGLAAAAGCIITAAGTWVAPVSPVAAVVTVALGNALFHVGGGMACLRLEQGRAAWAGIFVAPGAIGLFLGKQLGGTALYQPWALTLLLAAGAFICMAAGPMQRPSNTALPPVKGLGFVAAALLLTVAIRSLVGYSVSYPWVAGWQQAVWLTLAVFAGKALGGALGDKLGWRTISVAGLLVSAPLLAWGAGVPILAIAGSLCFNLTMAVTLAGMAKLLPGHEGLAFGLTTTAIVVGLFPAVIPAWKPFLGSPVTLAACILLSAVALWVALGRLEDNSKLSKGVVKDAGKTGSVAS
jgi:MFS transporter, FSR family, fosmidomycin resistance protein